MLRLHGTEPAGEKCLILFWFFTELFLKWFAVRCNKLQAAAQWNRGQECVWNEMGNSQQLDQLSYCRVLATPRCMGGEAGKLLLLVETRSHN